MAESRNRRRCPPTVHISELGFEDGKKRFRNSETGDAVSPYVCAWRNNLTALSQRYNLYFVAAGDEIQVYQPSFPFQVLSDQPALVIAPPVVEDGNPGYIQPDLPHGINNMVIGDLGDEEILLLSCDDGDVAAFHTKVITNEIKRREADLVKHEGHGIRAFFSQNVGQSAWGLAIHTRARMIAVSSNTKEITVFAFCLVDQQSDSEKDQSMEEDFFDANANVSDWKPYNSASGLSGPNGSIERRSHNIMTNLEGHEDNIPSVAFFNSDHDPEGRWLISTDIGGQIRVWDIWSSSGTCVSEFRSWPDRRAQRELGRSAVRGWSVLCVDHRAFRLVESLSEVLGTSSKRVNTLKKPPFDITETAWFVSDSSQIFDGATEGQTDSELGRGASDLYGFIGDVPDPDDPQPDSGADSEDGETNMLEDDSISSDSPPHYDPGERPELAGPRTASDEKAADEDNTSEVVLDRESSDDDDQANDPFEGEAKVDSQNGKSSKRRLNKNASQTGPGQSGENTRETAPLYQKPVQPRHSSDAGTSVANLGPPPFAMLHTTASGIFLYPESLSLTPEPSVCCFGALDQVLALDLLWLDGINRLNMAVQIPELGIVILATQKGRAVVLALTKLKHSKFLGFRLEWILPFKSQEKARRRPSCPLLGLAVAPVQGREITTSTTNFTPLGRPSVLLAKNEGQAGFRSTGEKEAWRGVESSRRYRLLMTYYDHSVLSYDISWNGGGNGGVKENVADPGHEDLLVV